MLHEVPRADAACQASESGRNSRNCGISPGAMAKGTKRKKLGVGIDFRRVKSKVGKKLPKAQNETDMSFKSKSINLPGQSLTEDKTGLAVSQRNLTTQVRSE